MTTPTDQPNGEGQERPQPDLQCWYCGAEQKYWNEYAATLSARVEELEKENEGLMDAGQFMIVANDNTRLRQKVEELTKENAELKNAYNRLEKQSREYGQYGVKKDEECTTLRSRVAELEGIIRDWLKAIPNRSINFPYYEVMLKSEAALKSGD